jgi:uncharacterized protein with PQ loop repeat
MEIIGWIGSMMLALCAVPQAIQSFRQKHSRGISSWMIGLWFAGEVLTAAYVLPKQDYPLLLNYAVNIGCLVVIGWYKYRPKVTGL